MTRHNLDEHLSWLLSTKASIPPNDNSLPIVSISFTPLEASQPTPDETIPEKEVPSRQSAAPVEVRPQATQEMVKLRAAPGSASRRSLISVGPALPDATPSYHAGSAVVSRPAASRQPVSMPTTSRQNPLNASRATYGSPEDVEVMDLTESLSQMDSPTPGKTAGRKRKSSEFEEDLSPVPCPKHGRRPQAPTVQPLHASQQSFAAIDEIMEQPDEPPPPYSTIPPRPMLAVQPARASSSTLSNGRSHVMPDSEDDEDDNLVDFTSRTIDRSDRVSPRKERNLTAQKPVQYVEDSPSRLTSRERVEATSNVQDNTPASRLNSPKAYAPSAVRTEKHVHQPPLSTQSIPSQDSVLLRRFFDIPKPQVCEAIQCLEARQESIVHAIASRYDQELDASDLEREDEELEQQRKDFQALSSMSDEYRRLRDEKDQLYAGMVHAVRTRQGKEEALAANKAGKEKLERYESACLAQLRSCRVEVEALVGSEEHGNDNTSDRKAIAVQSTQAPRFGAEPEATAVPSSSRIAQTQMVRPDGMPPSKRPPAHSVARKQEVSPSNYEAYFSPSKKRGFTHDTAVRANGTAFDTTIGNNEPDDGEFDTFNDVHDDDMFAASDVLFTNRMGTPPGRFHDENDDDFGMADDDEMLGFAEELEHHGPPPRHPKHGDNRPVFAETSGNSQNMAGPAGGKKTKKTPHKAADADLEEALFRFSWSQDVKRALKERFLLRGFRPNQLQAINTTLSGKDTFVLMPTGGGKSLCYQLPSLVSSGRTRGVTVVISPLLSLMEDQVSHLRKNHIQAFMINGETGKEERDAVHAALGENNVEDFIQLLYVTPEMLSSSQYMIRTFDRLYQRQRLARLVIDEAHCVSQWGHDFRPDYKLLGDVRRKYPSVPVMALTATATENVKIDVIHNLGIKGCEVFTSSFNRPNLHYDVCAKAKGKGDIEAIANIIKDKHPRQTGIIYCFSRKNCEDMAEGLRKQHKVRAHHYHAGMKPDEKSSVQKKWQAGQYHVIVATIAFGMGIDKGDVRFVIHHTIPKSLEGYYQETGRAGRDGKQSSCYLFYGYQDAGKIRRMIDDGDGSWEQKDRQHQMFRKMVQYCENKSDCRRVQVLGYFNESFDPEDCEGHCDNCNSESTFENVDFTDHAQEAISLVRKIEAERVTVLYCIDVFRGASSKKIKDRGHDTLNEFGVGKELDRGDLDRLFSRLLTDDALREDNVVNKMGFANQYVALGRNCNGYTSGKNRLRMQIRMTPRAKARPAPAKKKTAKRDVDEPGVQVGKKKVRVMAPPSLPMSTNVSSPMQAASGRKQPSKLRGRTTPTNGYQRDDDFVVPRPEGDDYDGTDAEYSSDAFEPVRVAGKPERGRTRVLGPPITSDSMMENLDEIHRSLVESFTIAAEKKVEKIMIDKNLQTVLFSKTMLRRMAIYFTETEDQMLRIPDINPDRVQLYGKHFYKMIKDCRLSYEDLMAQAEDRPDPNAQNVIDLVSDEDDDEYGSFEASDLEEDDEGEASAYFEPPKQVQDFNAKFMQSQSAALRSASQSQPAKTKPKKGKQRSYRATGSTNANARKRGPFPGASRQPSNAYNDNDGGAASRVTKKRGWGKRTSGGGRNRGSDSAGSGPTRQPRGGGFNGISMMPT